MTPKPVGKAATKGARKPFALQYPFSDPAWPLVDAEQGQVIMELLCNLLEPIGRHRSTLVTPSKGKRDKKRKRKLSKSTDPSLNQSSQEPSTTLADKPPPPEIFKHTVVGFNSIVRCLDPAARQVIDQSSSIPHDSKGDQNADTPKLAAIFVDRNSQAEILWSQLPFLAAAARMRDPTCEVRIVPVPKGSASQLSSALGIRRVGLVAISVDAPGSKTLLEYVCRNIKVIEIPWLTNASAIQFSPTTVGQHVGPSESKAVIS